MNKPAPTNNNNDSATCATISPLLNRDTAPVVRRLCLSARRQIQARRAPRGRQAEQHAGQQRDGQRERQHTPIQTEVNAAGQDSRVFVGQRQERALAPEGEEHADRAAQRREQHTFGQQLPDQTPAPRADRQPHTDLCAAQGRPRQQQVRHVGAGNQQHQRHHDEQSIDGG